MINRYPDLEAAITTWSVTKPSTDDALATMKHILDNDRPDLFSTYLVSVATLGLILAPAHNPNIPATFTTIIDGRPTRTEDIHAPVLWANRIMLAVKLLDEETVNALGEHLNTLDQYAVFTHVATLTMTCIETYWAHHGGVPSMISVRNT